MTSKTKHTLPIVHVHINALKYPTAAVENTADTHWWATYSINHSAVLQQNPTLASSVLLEIKKDVGWL